MKTPAATSASLDPLKKVWQRIRAHLESERDRLSWEIREYPTPIPRCDAQFNYLLEQRERIAQQLQRIDALAASAAPIERAEAVIDESSYLSEAAKRELRSSLKAGRHEAEPS